MFIHSMYRSLLFQRASSGVTVKVIVRFIIIKARETEREKERGREREGERDERMIFHLKKTKLLLKLLIVNEQL